MYQGRAVASILSKLARVSLVGELFTNGAKLSKGPGMAESGDLMVITGGILIGIAGTTDLLGVERIQ